MVIIAVARVAGSLPVLRWAFFGAILAILVDFSDLFMMNLIQLGGVTNYQTFDKWIDQVYMLTFLWVAVRQWDGPGRTDCDLVVRVSRYRLRRLRIHRIEVGSVPVPERIRVLVRSHSRAKTLVARLRVHRETHTHLATRLHRAEADAGVHPPHLASVGQLHRGRRSNCVVGVFDRVVLTSDFKPKNQTPAQSHSPPPRGRRGPRTRCPVSPTPRS